MGGFRCSTTNKISGSKRRAGNAFVAALTDRQDQRCMCSAQQCPRSFRTGQHRPLAAGQMILGQGALALAGAAVMAAMAAAVLGAAGDLAQPGTVEAAVGPLPQTCSRHHQIRGRRTRIESRTCRPPKMRQARIHLRNLGLSTRLLHPLCSNSKTGRLVLAVGLASPLPQQPNLTLGNSRHCPACHTRDSDAHRWHA